MNASARRHWLRSALLRLLRPRCRDGWCTRNLRRKLAPLPSHKIIPQPMAGLARIRFRGSTKTAITIRLPCRTSNYRTFTTSKENWRAATAFTVWVRTIKATVSPGALPPPITATWLANTGRRGRRIRPSSPTPDLRFLRDRRSRRTRSMIFIRQFLPKGCTGSHLCNPLG